MKSVPQRNVHHGDTEVTESEGREMNKEGMQNAKCKMEDAVCTTATASAAPTRFPICILHFALFILHFLTPHRLSFIPRISALSGLRVSIANLSIMANLTCRASPQPTSRSARSIRARQDAFPKIARQSNSPGPTALPVTDTRRA